MQRSWIALGVIIALIVVAIVLLLPKPKPSATPAPESLPKVATETPKEPQKEPEAKGKETGPAEPPKKVEPVDSDAVLAAADEKLAAGKKADAYRLLSEALLRDPKAKRGDELRARLAKLSEEVFFSDRVVEPFGVLYKVVAGDSLGKLAKGHKTTVELLRRINGIKGDMLRIGQNLKVVPGGFDVVVDKSEFHLTVTKDGLWVREFRIGLGKNGTTPVGGFVAGEKLREPVYTAVFPPVPFGDKKNNPLGTRWITVTTDYGIHGTWEPQSVGKEESKGCVRMANEDVEWLFDLIVPGVSKITIKP